MKGKLTNLSQTKEYLMVLDKLIPSLIRHFQVGNPQRIQGIDITLQQYITLRAITRQGKCTTTELSGLLGVTAGTMSGMLNRLAANHYIKRERGRNDRRIVYIKPTEEAKKMVDRIISEQAKHSKNIIEKLTNKEKQDLMRIMNSLFRIINSLETNNKGN